MLHSKTFRLFISSTFDDFRLERDALQKRVFPALHKLCRESGFEFMPIDLRWGVNVDAQLDQRTMDLCLREVKACKSEPRPDFLILTGDRYGWIPLPFAIEKSEFEIIFEYVSQEKRALIQEWYKLDNNELPPSYILQKREPGSIYAEYDNWQSVEDTMRTTLQQAVLKTSLPDKVQKKYFTSAVEFEFQDYLSEVNQEQQNTLFFVERSIDKNGLKSKRFFGNVEKQNNFRTQVIIHTLEENTIALETKLLNETTISDEHIEYFVDELTKKFTNSINKEITRLNSLEESSEQEYQAYIKEELSKNIIGRDDEISKILTYIESDSNEPYLLYGTSGMGKSSVIATAIKKSEEQKEARVIYRFAGQTVESLSSKTLLTSILKELDLPIPSFHKDYKFTKDLERIEKETFIVYDKITDMLIEEDDFEFEVQEALQSIQESTVIYIDALDQLEDKSKCNWLPNKLNPNLKIVISLLKDDHYKDDNYYFDLLKEKGNAKLYQLSPLEDKTVATNIFLGFLYKYKRTVQFYQLEHILEYYKQINSPLYLTIVANEARFFESNKTNFKLENSQKGAIFEYLENLTKLFHHEKLLIEKTFGYIYASRASLSETMLTEVLSKDKELLEVVENEFHDNINQKLPAAVWARLQHQIDPFLKTKKDGSLDYFHREFGDAAKYYYNEQRTKKLLTILEEQIHEDKYKNTTLREIHIKTLTLFHKIYPHENKISNIEFIIKSAKINEQWVKIYIRDLQKKGTNFDQINETYEAASYSEICYLLAKPLYTTNPVNWVENYIASLNNLFNVYHKINKKEKAIKLQEEALSIIKELYKVNPVQWKKNYAISLSNLSEYYDGIDEMEKAIRLQEEALSIHEELYKNDPISWSEDFTRHLNNLARYYRDINQLEYAKELILISQSISYKGINIKVDNAARLTENYAIGLDIHASYYIYTNEIQTAIQLHTEALSIFKEFYEANPTHSAENYIASLHNLASSYMITNQTQQALELLQEALSIITELYEINPARWAKKYTTSLHHIAIAYEKNNQIEKAITFHKKNLCVLKLFFSEDYVFALNTIGSMLFELKSFKDSINYFQEYFRLFNIKSINQSENLSTFIQPFFKYYEAVSYSGDTVKLKELEQLATQNTKYLKAKFLDEYHMLIAQEFTNYNIESLNCDFDNEKMDIFWNLFD